MSDRPRVTPAVRELVPAPPAGGIPMVKTPRWVSLLCLQDEPGACPAVLPRPSSSGTVVQVTPLRKAGSLAYALDVAWGGASGHANLDRPPRLVHVTVSGSARPSPAEKPGAADGAGLLRHGYPKAPVMLGGRDWTRPPGTLSVGASDCFGDHVCYRWSDAGGGTHLISIHAWAPLTQTLAIFAAVIRSIPS